MQGIRLMPEKKVSSARSQASFLMDRILGEKRLLADLNLNSIMQDVSAADRARSQRLLLNTLRSLERADDLILPFLEKRPNLKILNVLRLATVEIMDNGDAHGIVNEYVSIIGRNKQFKNYKGLVNAVLRKVSKSDRSIWDKLDIPQLPRWLLRILLDAYGNSVIQKIEEQHLKRPPVDLTFKNSKLMEYFSIELKGAQIFKHSLRLKDAGQISALRGFAEGDWWVQDLSASIPVCLFKEIKGKSAIDLWAEDFNNHSFGGGESTGQLLNRVWLLMENAKRRHEDQIWVTHAGVIKAFQFIMNNGEPYIKSAADWPIEATNFGDWITVDITT